jgi:eukaryotic-like serine/threonine-protein kinase
MNFSFPGKKNTLGSLLLTLVAAGGTILLLAIIYFYIYLPATTNHGESVTVPDLTGMKIEDLEKFLTDHDLSFEVSDSAYSAEYPPLTVLQQFPKAGSQVKENRKILIAINRTTPPSVPVPDLINGSRINAEVVLKSNELKRGRIILDPSPFLNLVTGMRYLGKPIEAGVRVPKGAAIDLIVGDGNGAADFKIGDLVGDSYQRALFKLEGWNLRLGDIEIPEGVDTTGIEPIVYKQYPEPGDSVRVGDPIDLWIGPKGYVEIEQQEN